MENFTTKELTQPDDGFVPASQNPNNFFVRYKKLLIAGGIVATYLLYKKFK